MNAWDAFFCVVGAIVLGVISSEVADWILPLARWIVRHQATKMGDQAERYREEWLADLADTPGKLVPLWNACGTLTTPLKIGLDRRINLAGGLGAFAFAWLRNVASLIVAAGVALLLTLAYPPTADRVAAYTLLVGLTFLIGLSFCPPVRWAGGALYGRLNYAGRVVLGGMTVPVFIALAVSATLIPPSWQPPPKAPHGEYASLGFDIPTFRATQTETGRYEFLPTKPSLDSTRSTRLSDSRVQSPSRPPRDVARRRPRKSKPLLEASPLLAFSEFALVPLEEQPIPSMQDYVPPVYVGPPSIPTGLRIFPG